MLTNLTALLYRRRCLKAGADFFIDKSTEIGKVKEIIQELVELFDSKAVEKPRCDSVGTED